MAKDPDSPTKKKTPKGALVALGAVAVTVPLLLLAARNGPDHDDRPRDPLELSDEGELRVAVEAVSGIIRAAQGEEEDRAIRVLEALHPRTPGASDLRDSCVTTYRGNYEAHVLQTQMRALLPDSGDPSPEVARRLSEMLDRANRLVSEANDAHLRCIALYEAAATRLHIAPAQRANRR